MKNCSLGYQGIDVATWIDIKKALSLACSSIDKSITVEVLLSVIPERSTVCTVTAQLNVD
jgi:hypothetical protein